MKHSVDPRPEWYHSRYRVIHLIADHIHDMGAVADIVSTPSSVMRDFRAYPNLPKDVVLLQILPEALSEFQIAHLVTHVHSQPNCRPRRRLAFSVATLTEAQTLDQRELARVGIG